MCVCGGGHKLTCLGFGYCIVWRQPPFLRFFTKFNWICTWLGLIWSLTIYVWLTLGESILGIASLVSSKPSLPCHWNQGILKHNRPEKSSDTNRAYHFYFWIFKVVSTKKIEFSLGRLGHIIIFHFAVVRSQNSAAFSMKFFLCSSLFFSHFSGLFLCGFLSLLFPLKTARKKS